MQHIHKYKRFEFSNGRLAYRCMLPGCRHYILPQFLMGQRSICWRCGNAFTINAAQARMAKPTCCKEKKMNEVEERALDELMKELGVAI